MKSLGDKPRGFTVLGRHRVPHVTVIHSELPREGSAGITELREESVEVGGFTLPVETPVAPP